MTKEEALDLALELRELADRFSEGWHDGIKIDASDIMLLSMAASQIEQARSAPVQSCYCPNCEAMGKELAALSVEREKAKHNEEVLMNALWKACGDDEQLVEATIESQGELK
jgi:hypothetical protein